MKKYNIDQIQELIDKMKSYEIFIRLANRMKDSNGSSKMIIAIPVYDDGYKESFQKIKLSENASGRILQILQEESERLENEFEEL